MAVLDDRGTSGPRSTRSGSGSAPEFDRQPPQDIPAEQSVLGAVLLSKDAIADVVEMLRPDDFYRPAHQTVYECVLDLYGRGEPADPVTVSAELENRGELLRVGGAPYLHTLIATVPTAANAAYYAEIVADRAILRRLVEAGTRIVQLGYHGSEGADTDDVVDRAQAAVYEVTDRRIAEDYVALEDILQPTMDEIDAIASRGGVSFGVPTGFTDLDQVTNGLHPGQMVIVAARPGIGKALALDTPLATPAGWSSMGDITVGDELFDADGRPTRVVAATEVMTGRPCFEVELSDGTVLVADAEHQWLTDTRASRRSSHGTPEIRTTAEIARTLRCDTADRRVNHAIAVARPLQLPERDLPVPPYAFGVWLGAGTSHSAAFTSADPDVALHVEAEGLLAPEVGPLRYGLRLPPDPGVLGVEHIPSAYMRASERQRRALLSGLLDTDGTVAPTGAIQFAVTEVRLADDVEELVCGLGYRCSRTSTRVRGRRERTGTAHLLSFSTDDDVFGLERKRLVHKERRRATVDTQAPLRYVVDVREVHSVPVRCVEVDNLDHLYLAGRSMVPTHNSTLGLDFARSASVKHGLTSVVFSLEMSRTEIVMRMLSAEAKIRLADMRAGTMTDDDWTRLARRMSEISEAPMFIDDSPNLTVMEIRAKARRLKQRHDLKLIILDYMQLMTSGKKVESRQQEVSEFSRQLKLLAKELEVPVVAISQLNRGPEQRTDKRPMLSDLRESGCLTLGTRVLRADTGAETTLGGLLSSGSTDVPVWSLDDRLRMVPRPMTHVFSTGEREVFRLRLTSGREVEATASHRMMGLDGWRPLGELEVGDRLAVPRSTPDPLQPCSQPEAEVVMLAHLLGLCSHEKFVPPTVFALPRAQVARFLHHLWASEGSVRWDDKHRQARIDYWSTSRRLVDDVARLLLRLGIAARIERVPTSGYPDSWSLHVYGAENQLLFLDEVGVHGARGESAQAAASGLRKAVGTSNLDTVPREVWDRVRAALDARGMSRTPLARAAAVLEDADLELLASNDVHWDSVAEITPLGIQPVYDATVPGTHNFVANGIVVHNSLEQDADMVMLISRPDAFERDDPRAGEADLILAKHRNGPTATITVAHQLHYSRFSDIARG